jgi:hypothetical protein
MLIAILLEAASRGPRRSSTSETAGFPRPS